MRKLLAIIAAVGMLGTAGYSTVASADSMTMVPLGSLSLAPGGSVTINIVYVITTSGLIFATNDFSLSSTAAGIVSATNNPGVFGGGISNWALRTSSTMQNAQGSCPTGNISVATCTDPAGAQFAGIYGGTTGGALSTGTFTVGSITIQAFGPGSTTVEFTSRDGVSIWADASGNEINPPPTQNSLTITVIPEPATAGLIGLGLVGLVLAGRRSRA
jgi:hypothetical protein